MFEETEKARPLTFSWGQQNEYLFFVITSLLETLHSAAGEILANNKLKYLYPRMSSSRATSLVLLVSLHFPVTGVIWRLCDFTNLQVSLKLHTYSHKRSSRNGVLTEVCFSRLARKKKKAQGYIIG